MPGRIFEVVTGVAVLALLAITGTWAIVDGVWWRGLALYLVLAFFAAATFRRRPGDHSEGRSHRAELVFSAGGVLLCAVLVVGSLVVNGVQFALIAFAAMLANGMKLSRIVGRRAGSAPTA